MQHVRLAGYDLPWWVILADFQSAQTNETIPLAQHLNVVPHFPGVSSTRRVAGGSRADRCYRIRYPGRWGVELSVGGLSSPQPATLAEFVKSL